MATRWLIGIDPNVTKTPPCLALLALAVAGLAAMGCSASSTARSHQEWMPCSRAAGVAREALLAMDYHAEITRQARVGAPGEVAAQKTGRWTARNREPGHGANVLVRIDCSDRGADFEAATDASYLHRLGFDRRFSAAIDAAAQRQQPRVRGDTARGVLVDIEAGASDSVADGPAASPTVATCRAVRVKIENRTERRYRFRRDQVRLVSQEGQRLTALDGSEEKPGARMGETLASEATIEPNSTLEGVLYFPATTYRRGTVVLIDAESDEPEGFSVEF